MKLYNLYGLKAEEKRSYMEELLISLRPLEQIKFAQAFLIQNTDFHSFRISEVIDGKPDFISCLNITK